MSVVPSRILDEPASAPPQPLTSAEKTARYRKRHPGKVAARLAKERGNRLERAKALFTSPFVRNPIISPELLTLCKAAGEVFVFQSPQHTLDWADALPVELRHEIVAAGLSRLIPQVRELTRAGNLSPDAIARSRAKSASSGARAYAKVKAFDRIVEMLDHRQIGEKKLGDCARADLLREAARLEAEAGEMTLDAALYRDLAKVIGNQTVRAASGRDKIVALLTHRWSEDGD